ncbi:MAG: hydroxyacid dehydrogenase [Defluviitaleaceae bacterium]|nr:hydroxyacid dehydrogenase [Defluviitaleaceae bacterium]
MNIVLLEPLGISGQKLDALAAPMKAKGHNFAYSGRRIEAQAEQIGTAKDADIVILANVPFRSGAIGACPNLKMVSIAFTGTDHVDTAFCAERGIAYKNCAGYSTNSVAELAFGMAISLLRNSLKCDAAVRAGKTKDGLVGNDLCGKTLGIMGLGAIGMKVCEIGKAFGCEILAYTRTERDVPGVKFADLDTLLRESDVVTLHTPLNDETKGMIGRREIALMKPSAILINTARGPVVDYAALAEALTEGRIAGAGVDVFETEPPVAAGHPLFAAPNTILAPHVGFATKEALERRADMAFDNVYKFLEGAGS